MLQRFSIPRSWLPSPSLDLVAKTVVDGFVAGLHRSPDFGFSQEFAEYRAYTSRATISATSTGTFSPAPSALYLKRYRGETNMQLLILLDASASMTYGSGKIRQAGLRALPRRFARLPVVAAARRHRPDRVRSRTCRITFRPPRARAS